jgi:hypothetical protein
MSSNNGESLERWLRPLPFALFLAAALFACFPAVLIGAESFFIRDYGVLGYPTIQFQRECFWRGELPLWNPYSNCGQPFLAQWGTMTLYPFSLIYLLLPLPWSLSVFCFAHVWLGGFGMYLLVRHWTKVNFAAALAGTTYAFSGIMFATFVWSNYLVTLGWMPFVVLLAERAWREGGRWVIGAALVSALQMLSGVPEVILFTWLIIGALWLCDMVRAPVSALPFLRRIIFVILLTSGLVAVQLLPFFELLQQSHRDVAFGTSKWQLPLWGWANFFVPLFNAFETPQGQYYQYEQGFLSSVYLGNVALVFALVALVRWPDVRVWILFLFCIVCVFLAFGDQTPVFKVARKVLPFVGMGRYPVKFLIVLAFAIPLLAGCGLAAVMQGKRRGTVHAFAVVVFAAMIFIVWVAREHRFVDYNAWPDNFRQNVAFSWHKASPGKQLPDAISNTVWRAGLFILAIATLSTAARRSKASPLFAIAGLALIAADVRTHTPKQNPSLPSALFMEHYWPTELPKQLGQTRAMITPQDEAFLTYLTSTNAARMWEFQRRAEWSNLNLLDEVAKVNGSSTLQTREQRLVEQALYSMTNRLPAALLDFLGVAYTSSNAQWLRRESALPLVTAGQQPLFVNDSLALATLTNNSFAPTQVVLLPETALVLVPTTNSVAATISSVRFTPSTVEADVNAPQPTIAVIAQSFYPAWKATVDGKDVPLLRANLAFQAVPVPAGQHHVRLVYSDAKFRMGLMISSACLLLCGLLWWHAGRTRRFE